MYIFLKQGNDNRAGKCCCCKEQPISSCCLPLLQPGWRNHPANPVLLCVHATSLGSGSKHAGAACLLYNGGFPVSPAGGVKLSRVFLKIWRGSIPWSFWLHGRFGNTATPMYSIEQAHALKWFFSLWCVAGQREPLLFKSYSSICWTLRLRLDHAGVSILCVVGVLGTVWHSFNFQLHTGVVVYRLN